MSDERELYANPDDVAAADQLAAEAFPGLPVVTSHLIPSGHMMVADPARLREDLRRTFDEMTRARLLPPRVTIHHPNCAVFNVLKGPCTCGGDAFPT